MQFSDVARAVLSLQ